MLFPYKEMIEKINHHTNVILAISGGVDSMFLLDFYKSKFKGKFIVCHFNHKIRNESDIEQDFIEKYCLDNNIEYYVDYGKDLNSDNMEHKASLQRWDFFERISKENNINVIVTAHHLNDKIENFLLQMMRGVPVESIIMKEETEKNNFIRFKPFLTIEKDLIYYHAKRLNLTWFEDESNKDIHHDRNFIRNVILPQMMERRNVTKTIPKTINSIENLLINNL